MVKLFSGELVKHMDTENLDWSIFGFDLLVIGDNTTCAIINSYIDIILHKRMLNNLRQPF